jgi:hypothetical protein
MTYIIGKYLLLIMCTELFLAILYFLTILIVNYFLFKLLTSYLQKITYLLKIKNILTTFPQSKFSLVSQLHKYSSLDSKFSLKFFNNISSTKDVFIIGNTYKYLVEALQTEKSLTTSTLYYLQLLENQYLSNSIRLK